MNKYVSARCKNAKIVLPTCCWQGDHPAAVSCLNRNGPASMHSYNRKRPVSVYCWTHCCPLLCKGCPLVQSNMKWIFLFANAKTRESTRTLHFLRIWKEEILYMHIARHGYPQMLSPSPLHTIVPVLNVDCPHRINPCSCSIIILTKIFKFYVRVLQCSLSSGALSVMSLKVRRVFSSH